ncbi:unnamed protein product [Pleuronectes platessa]|uniref:Uncharacterized protein n=1 Tax=Pleuronectes platessa TaxID=8262 RepID=A0A9N7YAI7_PLEPL|nr:unnamed protein product [Pleuronectes platessa]
MLNSSLAVRSRCKGQQLCKRVNGRARRPEEGAAAVRPFAEAERQRLKDQLYLQRGGCPPPPPPLLLPTIHFSSPPHSFSSSSHSFFNQPLRHPEHVCVPGLFIGTLGKLEVRVKGGR